MQGFLTQLDKYFRFQTVVLDSQGVQRTFIAANNQSITRIKPFECSMPLEMEPGWNQIVFDLDQYCNRAFGSRFQEVVSVQIHANTRIVRLYFNDVAKTEDEIPPDYKLFMRVQPLRPA